jgi:hypothetical protein
MQPSGRSFVVTLPKHSVSVIVLGRHDLFFDGDRRFTPAREQFARIHPATGSRSSHARRRSETEVHRQIVLRRVAVSADHISPLPDVSASSHKRERRSRRARSSSKYHRPSGSTANFPAGVCDS